MKKLFFLIMTSTILVTACNNNKSKEKQDSDPSGSDQKQADPVTKNGSTDYQQIKEDLEKLDPRTEDEMKALIPEELMGGLRTDFNAKNEMGTMVAYADYIIQDSIKVKIEIIDCAGAGGAGMFGLQYINMINVNSDDEAEYVKTIGFKDGKAIESCKKKRNRCSLAWFSGNRFLVTIQGDHTGIDAIKEAAKGLDVK